MSTDQDRPSLRLLAALADVRLDPGALRASLGDTVLEASGPRDMISLLSRELYRRVHARITIPDAAGQPQHRDLAFEEALARATPHRTCPTAVLPAPGAVTGQPDRIEVEIDGVRVWLPRAMLDGAQPPAIVHMPAARAALCPGFVVADGPRGRYHEPPVIRVYVHIERPEAACRVWNGVLGVLNGAGVNYRAKVASAPARFPRQDAMVVYLGRDAWHSTALVRDAVRDLAGQVGGRSSPYTRVLAPGVSAAWEPVDARPGYRELSFGEHRSRAIAEGLVAHATGAASSREEGLCASMRAASIDPVEPARNRDSPPIPSIGFVGSAGAGAVSSGALSGQRPGVVNGVEHDR
jgi:hypothetical protein